MNYRVILDTATRESPDPADPGYDRWVDWPTGKLVKVWPNHVDPDDLVASGAWEPIEPAPEPEEAP